MKCHICGARMESVVTDLPFKISMKSIVILKDLPVQQCGSCGEYLLDDPIMERVEQILERVDPATELEIIRFAA